MQYIHSYILQKYILNSPHFPPFYVGSRAIEFVNKWPHVGHVITSECDDTFNILSKKKRKSFMTGQ
jgi:hypothetical protein